MFNLAKPLTGKPAEQAVLVATHQGNAAIAESDSAIAGRMPPTVDETPLKESGKPKLSRLIDHDFPFDESQIEAIQGLVSQKFGCMTGAAGTGKTTCTKKLVDDLQDELTQVDMTTYWKRGVVEEHDDEYEVPEDYIPSVVMCSFTGRSTQMTKKNFPRDWHGNIMTIHRMLGFMPEFYEDFDEETQEIKNKMRFVPTYNSENKLPWDIIIIDEAGMLGLDLWHQLWAACRDSTRIIMIGDINQLPPTHGKSIFGFALSEWPSWELTHVHRQQGANNAIVDNASLEDLAGTMNEEPKEKAKESRDRGPASHIVTIRFGDGDHAFELQFSTLAEVASLMTAYVVTCHKMQGGEAPVIIVIVHHSHKRMLFREWLYTAITRASQRCIVLYTRQGLATALNKQNIRGVTLAQKVEAFQKLQEKGIVGAAVKVNIPDPESTSKEVMIAPQTMLEKKQVDSSKALAELAAMDDTLPAEQTGIDPGNPELPPYQKAWDHQAKVDSETVNIFVNILTESKITINEAVKKAATPEVVDGGDLDPLSDEGMKHNPFRDVKMATYGSLEYYRQKEENRQKALEKIDSRKNQIVAEQSAKMLALSNHLFRHPIPKPMEQELRESQVLAPAIELRPVMVVPQPIRSTFKLNLVGLKK
jgi:hypothetical protein